MTVSGLRCSTWPSVTKLIPVCAHLLAYYVPISLLWGRRAIGISGSLIWSKTLMELIFNPCGEFR